MNHEPVSIELLLRRLLGWAPTTSIEEGVRRAAETLDSPGEPR